MKPCGTSKPAVKQAGRCKPADPRAELLAECVDERVREWLAALLASEPVGTQASNQKAA